MTARHSGAAADGQMPNGSACAAILAAGVGSFTLGLLAWLAECSKSLATLLIFYAPTGPLSGVTTVSILWWLAIWLFLAKCWRGRAVAISKINIVAFVLLGLGLLLTFPPFMDCLPGK